MQPRRTDAAGPDQMQRNSATPGGSMSNSGAADAAGRSTMGTRGSDTMRSDTASVSGMNADGTRRARNDRN